MRIFWKSIVASLFVATVVSAGIITDRATVGDTTVSALKTQADTADGKVSTLQTDAGRIENNIIANSFRISINGALTSSDLDDGVTDQFEDQSGVNTGSGSNYTYSASGDYYGYAAQVTASVIPTNLALFYNMEDNSASTVVSDDAYDSDGVAVNNTSAMTAAGKIGNGFDFNGTTDYITNSVHDYRWLDKYETEDFSIVLWINCNDWTPAQHIMTSSPDTSNDPYFEVGLIGAGGSDVIRTIVRDDASSGPNITSSLHGWTDGTWHHYAVTWDASLGIVRQYLDGELDGADTNGPLGTVSDWTANDNLPLGAKGENNGTYNSFVDGKMDMFMIYTNRVLSDADVWGLYNDGNGVDSYASISSNQTVRFDMEDTSGTTATDSSGNGNDGTSANNISTMTTTGKIGLGFDFNGSSDRLTTPALDWSWCNKLDTESYSVSVWLQNDDWTPAGGNQSVAGIADSDNHPYMRMIYLYGGASSGKFTFDHSDDSSTPVTFQSPVNGFVDGTWHHFAGVWNHTEKVTQLWVDGVHFAGGTNLSFGTVSAYTSADPFYIGSRSASGSPYEYWAGDMDQFVLYTNKVLTAAEIGQLYNGGSGSPTDGGTTGGTMELISTNGIGANPAPTNARVVIAHENMTGTATFGTDVKGYVSSDDGTTWDEMVFGESMGELSAGIDMYAGTNVLTSGDTNMLWKIETTDNTKAGRIHAVGTLWKE